MNEQDIVKTLEECALAIAFSPVGDELAPKIKEAITSINALARHRGNCPNHSDVKYLKDEFSRVKALLDEAKELLSGVLWTSTLRQIDSDAVKAFLAKLSEEK